MYYGIIILIIIMHISEGDIGIRWWFTRHRITLLLPINYNVVGYVH